MSILGDVKLSKAGIQSTLLQAKKQKAKAKAKVKGKSWRGKTTG